MSVCVCVSESVSALRDVKDPSRQILCRCGKAWVGLNTKQYASRKKKLVDFWDEMGGWENRGVLYHQISRMNILGEYVDDRAETHTKSTR
jgi:hypothetical protein